MIWSDMNEKFDMELEVEFRDEIHYCEVTRIYQNIESDPEEGFWWPVSYTYEFKVYKYNELTQDWTIPIEDLTEPENIDLQKYIDEYAADQAAAAAEAAEERRYDR